jgi:hypothetical protein
MKLTNLGDSLELSLANRLLWGRICRFCARHCDKSASHGHLQLRLKSAEEFKCYRDFLRFVSPKISLPLFEF